MTLPYGSLRLHLLTLFVTGLGIAVVRGDRIKLDLRGEWRSTNGPVWSIVVMGTNAYCGNGDGGLAILDVSDTTNPRELGRLVTGGYTYRVAVSGKYAYAAAVTVGLHIIDVSDPTNPQRRGTYIPKMDSAYGVAVAGNYAYVLAGNGGVEVIDVSDPATPRLLGQHLEFRGYAMDIAIAGNLAYVADGNAGLTIIDTLDIADIRFVGRYETRESAACVAVSGNHAFIGDAESLRIIDCSDPSRPKQVGACSFRWDGFVRGIVLSGPLAFVANGHNGLAVADVSDPTSPYRVGGFDTDHYSYGVAVSANNAYVADHWGGLLVLRITELPAITRTERVADRLVLEWNEPATGMTLQGTADLANPNWQDVPESSATNRAALLIRNNSKFYRLRP